MLDPVQVWLADAEGCGEATLGRMAGQLGEGERRRCAAFLRPLRRRQFIVGRALARAALGELLAVPPQAIRLEERPGLAPLLAAPAGAAHFSIAHSGRWVACAVRRAAPVGLDIELADPGRDVLALARQAFGAQQASALHALPAGQRSARFYQWWCAAEAAIKLGQAPLSTARLEHAELIIAVASVAALEPAPVLRSVDAGGF
jgi:4'-phosphopantetheinyl transferase